MFDHRWDNWAGDFTESFAISQVDPSARDHAAEILLHFGKFVRRHDAAFPDEVSPGTFAIVLNQDMPRLALPPSVRRQVPEVVAVFLEYLQESGRVGEGAEWAEQIREIGRAGPPKGKPEPAVKAVPIRKPAAAAGRNDPCPCGSGKKYKKCCWGLP
jgi:hypothetical protein